MRPVCCDLGAIAGVLLDEVARRCPAYRDNAFARWLGVDRSLVGHWRSGARPMPVEVLPHLARYCGDPEAVYGDLLARAGCAVAREDPDPDDPEAAISRVRLEVGRLLVSWEEGVLDGRLDPDEATALVDQLDTLRVEVSRLRAGLLTRRARKAKPRRRA